MSDTPKRRLRDQFGASPCFISEGAHFVGSFVTQGAVVVCGRVEGEGRIDGPFSLARDAEWVGNIHAREAVIAGRVTGDLYIDGKLEIGASAVIAGNVSARSLAIASGAVIESEVTVTSGEPVLHFEEQREEE